MATISLTDEDCLLFKEFQKHYQIVAPVVGYMSSLKLIDIANTHIGLDIDAFGIVKHMEITKHYRS